MNATTSNPLRLVRLLIFGTLLLCASYGLSFLPFAEPTRGHGFLAYLWSCRIPILLTGIPFLAGASAMWHAYRSLDSGVRWDRWTPSQLAPARALLESRVLLWSIGLVALAGFGVWLVLAIASHRHAGMGYMFIWAIHPLLRARAMLKPPSPPSAPEDWHNRRRFFSSHWGEPPTGHSEPTSS